MSLPHSEETQRLPIHTSLVVSDSKHPHAALSDCTFAAARTNDAWPPSPRGLHAEYDSRVSF